MKKNYFNNTLIELLASIVLITACFIVCSINDIVFADTIDNKFDGVDSVVDYAYSSYDGSYLYVVKDLQDDGGGTLWCIRSSTYAKNMGIDDVKKACASWNFAAVIKTDGTLWTYGNDSYGQRGVGGTNNSSWSQVKFEVESDVSVVDIVYNSNRMAALLSDGSLWMWGRNDSSQLGLGDELTETSYSSPHKVFFPGENVKIRKVSLGFKHSAAIDDYGKLYMWGSGSKGQISRAIIDDFHKYSKSPIELKIKDRVKKEYEGRVLDVSLGEDHSAVITDSDGNIETEDDRSLYLWGANDYGQLGTGAINGSDEPLKVTSVQNVRSISMRDNYSSATDKDGKLYMWGQCKNGNFGYDETGELITANRSLPQVVTDYGIDLNSLKSYDLWGPVKIAILNDGSVTIWGDVWDNNYKAGDIFGETETPEPNTKTIEDIPDIRDLSLGNNHTVALQNDGTVWTWGKSISGLGYGKKYWGYKKDKTEYGYYSYEYFDNPDVVKTPSGMKGTVKSVFAHGDTTAIISYEGELWFVTDGNYDDNCIMNNVSKFSMGENHYAAIDTSGHLWTWGHNDVGQLGDGTRNDSSKPVKIMPDETFKGVSLGSYVSAAVTTDGRLYMWGSKSSYALGNGSGYVVEPELVSGIDYDEYPIKNIYLSIGSRRDTRYSRVIAATEEGGFWIWELLMMVLEVIPNRS